METFEGRIVVNEGGGAWVEVPGEVVAALGGGGRVVEVPEDLAAALAGAGVREAFDGLSYSHRREHVQAINDAKKAETRQRRIAKCLEMLGDVRGS
ncbi:YdeI/OmpD-associated family protein [Kribbella shirazensis]|uniref:Uncharacterized protein YdeI (YjbR/CyaY-like superfamily) n=1 Tax=Kribbella shirazensis TaxID=1105143 RepID=A0A7X5VJ83_9ACTN|nr:YdeI/OmpD-associated family protein [Kribbella shirazensis]NIK62218.1 uncharacterized protein YdeI (YjbR/CyaY-like superfamily) [Kribbella shirazensis]